MSLAPRLFDCPPLRSLAFWGDDLVDWLGGQRLAPDGTATRFGTGSTYRFDSAIGFEDVGLLHETIGTKGVLVRWNGQLPARNFVPRGVDQLREVDRSYYHADDYTFPACLFRLPDGRLALAHCPRSYDALELELLDGTPLTRREAKDEDFFHSRLAASADGSLLLSHGWLWQPYRDVRVYDVARALAEPAHLASAGLPLGLPDAWAWEVDAATFVGRRVVVATQEEEPALAVCLPSDATQATIVKLAEPPGTTLGAWDDEHVVALDGTPRLISLARGETVHRWDGIPGGPGIHQPSVQMTPRRPPFVACDAAGGRFAVAWPTGDGPGAAWKVARVG